MVFAFVLVIACGKKEAEENTANTENTENVAETPKVEVQQPITDADKYEAKVVESEAGEWFVIKDGDLHK